MPPASMATLSRALRRYLRSLMPPRRRSAARGAAFIAAVLGAVFLLAAVRRPALPVGGGEEGALEGGAWPHRLSPPPPAAVPSLTINGEPTPVVGRLGVLSTGAGRGEGGEEGDAAPGGGEVAAEEAGGGGEARGGTAAVADPTAPVAQVLLVVNPRRWAASPPTVLAALLASLHAATYPGPVRLDVVLIADSGGGGGGLPPPEGEAAKRDLLRGVTWTAASGAPLGPLTTRTVRGRAYGGYLAAWAAAAAAVAGGGGLDAGARPPPPSPPPLVILEETSPPLHPSWFAALAAARSAYGADVRVAGYALHPLTSVRVRSAGVGTAAGAGAAARWAAAPVDAAVAAAGVALSAGLSAAGAAAFAPARRADWAAFGTWLAARRREWYLWPVIPPGLTYPPGGVGPGGAGDPKKSPAWAAFTGRTVAHWGGWHARYLAEVEGAGGVVAHLDVAALAAAGGGAPPPPTVSVPPLATLPRYTLNGTLVPPAGSAAAAAGAPPPLLPPDLRSQLLALAAAHGNTLSLTVVTRDFLPFARSWVCNVDAAGLRPPGVVWVATDADAAAGLAAIPATATVRLDALAAAPRGRRDGYGSRAYWGLMLARTRLIGELLGAGVDVFAFETDAVWLADPLAHIRSVLASDGDGPDGGGGVDLVGTFDSRHEVAGNLLYLRPTPATRRLWAAVTTHFAASVAWRYAPRRRAPKGDYAYIENDQSLLTKLLLYAPARNAVPVVFRALDTDRFVDGRWYPAVAGTPGNAGGAYTSAAAAAPVLVNINFVIGVGAKIARAAAAGHWFWVDEPTAAAGGGGRCDAAAVAAAVAANEARRVAAATRGGRGGAAAPLGGDVEADPDMVADAVLGVRG